MVAIDRVQTPAQWRAALDELIKSKHLTLDEIERRGVARATLSNIRTGTSARPRWSTAEKILRACALADGDIEAWDLAFQRAYGPALGVPLTAELNPFELGIHKAITADRPDVPESLTVYVPRPHDAELNEIVDAAAGGHSAMVVLVGDASTGKTRALWEAVARLRELGGWRIWHPTNPNRRTALRELKSAHPRTVVWLNETQEYLGGDDRAPDDDTAVELRNLVDNIELAPILIVGTLWPEYCDKLHRAQSSQVRLLLDVAATLITMPSTFTDASPIDLEAAAASDPRIAMARNRCDDGRLTQYLAGGPEMVRRYEFEFSPTARAIVEAAWDARRMGHRNSIPLSMLADTAPAYMTTVDWNRMAADADWLEKAIAVAARPCKGAEGPLTRIIPVPRPSRRTRGTAVQGGEQGTCGEPVYKLADYLYQYGRSRRRDIIPPIPFWEVAAHHSCLSDLHVLGRAAWDRGLYRDAAQLWKNAASHGDGGRSVLCLLTEVSAVFPGDCRPETWAIDQLSLDGPAEISEFLADLGEWTVNGSAAIADVAIAESRLNRQAAAIADQAVKKSRLDDPIGIQMLLRELRVRELYEQVEAIICRAATEANLDHIDASILLGEFGRYGFSEQANAIAKRLPSEARLGDAWEVGRMIRDLVDLGFTEEASVIADRATAETRFEDWGGLNSVLFWLLEAGMTKQANLIADRVATELDLDQILQFGAYLETLIDLGLIEQARVLAARAVEDPQLSKIGWILESCEELGLSEQVAKIFERISWKEIFVDPGGLGSCLALRGYLWRLETIDKFAAPAPRIGRTNPRGTAKFLDSLPWDLRIAEYATGIAERATTETDLTNPVGVADLLVSLRGLELTEYTTRIAERATTETDLTNPVGVADLLVSLRGLELTEYATRIAERATTETDLDYPKGVAKLLVALWNLELTEHATRIVNRATTEIEESTESAVTLLRSLQNLGLVEQAATLVHRLPGAAMFSQFLDCIDDPEIFRFGRDSDGRPADPWSWSDLD
ncbi:hypothetical protein ACWCPQ_32270 [Nocardia sp. NPDC001965]